MVKKPCTRCDKDEVVVSLKMGENLCDYCLEDWINEMWEEYVPGAEAEMDL